MGMDHEELDERKVKILDAIIRNYLATGEIGRASCRERV